MTSVSDQSVKDVLLDRVEHLRCPACGQEADVRGVEPLDNYTCAGCGKVVVVPGRIGGFLAVRKLGAGAMGTVYEAVDEQLGRRVAIKVIRPVEGHDSEADRKQVLQEFLNEARALAAINHPNVVQVHSIGQHRGQPFIVMELVTGKHRLEQVLAKGKVLDEPAMLRVAIDVAQGLATASKHNLVHGDVKPQNILVNAEGLAKVVDFGLAGRSGQAGEAIRGTPYYIAPERAQGKPVDARSDMFSLGATLWHLLGGHPPFTGKSVMEVVLARMRKPAPDIREVRPEISSRTAGVLAKMLATAPEDRHLDYAELIAELKVALAAAEAAQEEKLVPLLAASSSRMPKAPARLPPSPRPMGSSSRSLSARALSSTLNRRRRSPRATGLAVGGIATGLLALLAMITWVINRTEAPPDPGVFHGIREDFHGPRLPDDITDTGGGAFNGHGQFVLNPRAGKAMSLTRDLPPQAFTLSLALRPLSWDLDLHQEISLKVLDQKGKTILNVIATKDKVALPTLKAITVRGEESEILPTYRPDGLSLRIIYQPGNETMRLSYGTGDAEPVIPHPVGVIVVPHGSRPDRMVLSVSRAPGHTNGFSVGVDDLTFTGPGIRGKNEK